MKAFASALDSETAYFTPNEARQLLISMQQRLFGIGVLLRDDIDGFSVLKLVEGGPAARQGGLVVGDKLIAVNDNPVIGLELHEVVELIRGEPGTFVSLKAVRKSEVNGQQKTDRFDVRIRRGEVVVQDLRYGSKVEPFEDGVIAYLRLHSFYQDAETSSYDDLLSSLEKIQQTNNVKGVILDLRCNPGGLLTQAVSVAGLFLQKGIVVSIKDESGEVVHLRNLTSKHAWNGPLIILISRASASASEIVAQTLQDWGRAIVVGDDRSFGKGSFQLFTLNPDGVTPPNPQGEYKVTRGRYYTVSGKSPQLVGVQSDVYVPGLLCFAEVGEQFTRFPLTEDLIPPNFEDSFSDVSFFQRRLLSHLYEIDPQVKTDTWTRLIPQLQKNSSARINQNEGYQRLIDRAQKMHLESSPSEDADKDVDYQLEETWNILKDLIKLSSEQKEQLASKKAA
jgi:carboxyl-terminal processing protease